MFRTPSGQTGKSAYMYELAGIANARRELDSKMARLIEAMIAELPDTATYRMSIATERHPDAYLIADKDTMTKQLRMNTGADRFTFEFIGEVLATLNLEGEVKA